MFKQRLEYLLMIGAPNSGKEGHHPESAGESEPAESDTHTKEYCIENNEILDKVNKEPEDSDSGDSEADI